MPMGVVGWQRYDWKTELNIEIKTSKKPLPI
jgi:hypothetical protein